MWDRANQIFEYLDTGYTSLRKKSVDNLDFFDEVSGWDQIKHDNSFLDGGKGLLLGLREGRDIPRWGCKAEREWQEDYEDPRTIRPHIMLIICTGAEAKDNELLFGELGPIAQAIRNRLRQKEFEKTSLFPVLAVSLFGPRHGRLLQANFNNSSILEVRSSPIYSFIRKDSAPFELFLRYYACEPLDGPEYEFSDDTQTHQTIKPTCSYADKKKFHKAGPTKGPCVPFATETVMGIADNCFAISVSIAIVDISDLSISGIKLD
ncbi:hypothetical protein C8Q69DRAFT_448072 [Paecilomyces variotii]|uniref:Uncharacterized protein n=1 Tax=Byssochlamys spectabilis TaxID=264951 RepID=A0A443HJN7_BYSSP|nr:hypothetical protein C8Q69DRAFT_448072 [Paecilomyces variotii]RWQ91989.1 hypothetical protein C8Q69DRAFT_448072 [Paecilomyces variotii]